MNKSKISEIVDEIEKHWEGPTEFHTEKGDWSGPTGQCWCEEKNKFVNPEKCKDCPECEAIPIVDERPSRYLRPKETYW